MSPDARAISQYITAQCGGPGATRTRMRYLVNAPQCRLRIVAPIPTVQSTTPLTRVKWKMGASPSVTQRKEWRARAIQMIDTADGIPEGHRARMITVLCLLATRCDDRGEILMNLSSMRANLRRDGRRTGETTIRRALRDLERYGYIECETQARPQGAQTGNLYRLRPFLDQEQTYPENTPEETLRPFSTGTPTKPYHEGTPSSRSSLSIKASSSTVSSTPSRTPAPIVAAAITSSTEQTPSATRAATLRSAGMSKPEALALRFAAIPESVF